MSPPAAIQDNEGGKRMFRTHDGQMVELPPDMTAEEAAKLEAQAKVAEKRLGKGPLPKPVPDVKQPAKKEKKTAKPQAAAKGKKAGKGKGKAQTKAGAAVSTLLNAGTGKAAQYLTAKAAPVLARGVGRLRQLAQNEQTHDDASEKRNQYEKAVVLPDSEGQSRSNAGQVDMVGAKPAPTVDENKAKQKLEESLKQNIPQSIEDVDNFKRDKKAQDMGAEVMMVVQGDKNAVVSTFADMETTPPAAPPESAPEALPPEEIAPSTPSMNLGEGAIVALPKEHTDVSKYTKEADSKLKEEGVTQEQLDMVDSGDLAAANKEKKGLEKTAKNEPSAIQKLAQQMTDKVDKDLKQEEKKGREGLKAKRKNSLGATKMKQKNAKLGLEKKHEEISKNINLIYTKAQISVKSKLDGLEKQSMNQFDEGNKKATTAFEDNVKRELDAFKRDRYSGFFGSLKRAKDWLLGMDDLPEVKSIFERNRNAFVEATKNLTERINNDNKLVIKGCREELAKAKMDIKLYVNSLAPALKSIGNTTVQAMDQDLVKFDTDAEALENKLAQTMADKQSAAIKSVDDKIEKMKEDMSGGLAKLGKLLLLAAKKFFTWALEKFGYSPEEIEGIINKGAAVLKAIFTQPIKFVKNLVKAAITGFENFGKNFLKHLKNALFEWLTGSLEGLVLPQTWDFKGIISVALQMIGISYQNIRKHMVAVMGATVVDGLEKTFTLVKTLIIEGPMAAWDQLQEMAGEMKEAFIDAVKDFIKSKIIEEAIKWVASIFIPGAGIIKAIIAIYDTIVFFIQKAKQIAQMIGSFLSSIGEIAMGNIGAAATALENGLARGLTLVISFLAQLLHLGGITKKIKDAIQKIHAKVDAVLLKVAKWIWDKAKKLFGAAKAGVAKLLQWWKKKVSFSGGGESHTLLFLGEKDNAQLMVKTTPKKPEEFILDFVPVDVTSDQAKLIKGLSKEIDDLKKKIAVEQKKVPPDEAAISKIDGDLTLKFNALGQALAGLLNKSEEEGSEKNPVTVEYPKRRAAAYPNIYVGPLTTLYINQDWLKEAAAAGAGKKAKDKLENHEPKLKKENSFTNWSGAVKVFRADGGPGQTLPNGEVVGLDPVFANLAPGKVLVYDVKGKTGGGSKINNKFKPFGFRPGNEGMDGDHVMERQLGGPDAINNLWPLKSGENRSSGSTVKSMKVIFRSKSMTVHEAREKRKKMKALHLLIKRTKSE